MAILMSIPLSSKADGKKNLHTRRYKHPFYGSNICLETRLYYGFIINHHVGMEIYNSHFPSLEINISKATYGQKFWEQMFDYPWIGASYWYSALGSSPYLGSMHALFPYINFPLFRADKLTFTFRLGAGIGITTKKFERINNYKHLALGSRLNFAGNLLLELKYQVSDYWTCSFAAALTHFSNGSVKLPNYGLNLPAITFGTAYWLNKPNKPIEKKLYTPTKPFDFHVTRQIEFQIAGIIGFKNLKSIFGDQYYVYALHGHVLKRVTYKSKFGIGFDISYDGSDQLILQRNYIDYDHDLELIKTGLNLAYELTMGRLSFDFNYGFYLSGLDKSDGSVYHKVSLRYDINPNLFANIVLKTHWGKADFIGWGLGYQFKYEY